MLHRTCIDAVLLQQLETHGSGKLGKPPTLLIPRRDVLIDVRQANGEPLRSALTAGGLGSGNAEEEQWCRAALALPTDDFPQITLAALASGLPASWPWSVMASL